MKLTAQKIAEARKAAVAAVGAIAEGVSLGVFHGTVQTYAIAIVAIATAAGVYVAPNAPKKAVEAVTATPVVPPVAG